MNRLEPVEEPSDLLATYGASPLRRYEHQALGTWNVLLLADRDPGRPGETDRAAGSAFVLLDRLEDELSRFRPESDVSLLNALGATRPVPVGHALNEILVQARMAWEVTGGAFDPTVGPLMDAWGFPRGPARVPPAREIEELLRARGMDHVRHDPSSHSVFFDREGVAVDLGGIGKGFVVDRLKDDLLERGIPAGAILSGRSTLTFWGEAPGGGPWQVEVAHPSRPRETFRTLLVPTGSISTSAAYEDRFVAGGVEYGHIMDPRRGHPVRSSLKSVSVWTRTAVEADILSTALFVLGREEGEKVLVKVGMASALLIEEDSREEGGLRTRCLHGGSPGFQVAKNA